jgi:hypothetical protein
MRVDAAPLRIHPVRQFLMTRYYMRKLAVFCARCISIAHANTTMLFKTVTSILGSNKWQLVCRQAAVSARSP